MADAIVSTLAGALEQRVRAKLTAQPNRSTVLLNLLQKTRGSGKNIAFDVAVGTEVGQIFDDGENVSTYQNDTELQAILPWSIYGDAFAITGLAEAIAAGEPTALAKLYLKKLMDAGKRAASKINIDLYTGAGSASPQKIHGLLATAGPLLATGSYAGLDRGTYPQWASTYLHNSGTPRALSLKLIQLLFQSIYDASGSVPGFCVTTSSLWNRYAELVAPEKRYLQEVSIRGEVIKLDAGWQALEINGIPIFKDKDCPSGSFLAIDPEHVGVEQLPDPPELQGRAITTIPIAGTPQEQAGTVPDSAGVTARLIELGRAGDKSKFQLVSHLQLWTDKCNASGALVDLGS